ncbi:MAG: rod shape-determining protein RodA, partial [Chitinophagaceae bacterium]|nr:rod shape-determining protein RodA [Chitinophagaceae bacterium]
MSRTNKSFMSRLDGITVLLYLLLVGIGLLAIFSVEYRSTDQSLILSGKSHTRQLMWLGISVFIGVIIMFTDSKFFSSVAYLSYTVGLFLLLLTIFVGTNVKGSSSWLGVGPFRFQPGELCKIFTALALAKFLSSPETNFRTLTHRLIGAGFALVPAILIILQKETGLALVYFSFFLVMYREGLPHGILITAFSIIALTLITLLVDKTILLYILTGGAILIGLLIRKALRKEMMARVLLIGIWGICILFSQFVVPFMFKS